MFQLAEDDPVSVTYPPNTSSYKRMRLVFNNNVSRTLSFMIKYWVLENKLQLENIIIDPPIHNRLGRFV
jgi:hypothetical protein